MSEYFLRVYRVGHGLCTLVHYQDDSTAYNAVIDCGYSSFCSMAKHNGVIPEFDRLIDDIVQVVQGSGCLNLLVSSHQDADHNNMMMRLVSALNGWEFQPGVMDWLIGQPGQIWGFTAQGKKSIAGVADNLIEYRYDYIEEDTAIECMQIVQAPVKGQYGEGVVLKFTTDRCISMEDGSEYRSVFCLECHMVIVETEYIKMVNESEAALIISCAYENGESLAVEPEADADGLPVWLSNLQAAAAELVYEELGDMWIAREAVQWLKKVTDRYIAESLESCKIIWKAWKGDSYQQSFPIEHIILGGDSAENQYSILTHFMQSYVENMGCGVCTVCPYYAYFMVEDFQVSLVSSKENELYSSVIATEIGEEGEEIVTRRIGASEEAIQKNATAAVIHFCYNKSNPNAPMTILFPGDVTAHNLPDIQDRISGQGISYRVTSMIAPHHGSFHTNIVCNADGSIAEEQPLGNLYGALGQVFTYISECYQNDVYHVPRWEYVECVTGHSFATQGHGISLYRFEGVDEKSGSEQYSYEVAGSTESIYNTGNLYWNTEQGSGCYDYYEINFFREPAEPVFKVFASRANAGQDFDFGVKSREGGAWTAETEKASRNRNAGDGSEQNGSGLRRTVGADRSDRCLPPDKLFL